MTLIEMMRKREGIFFVRHDLRAFLADTNHMTAAQLGAFIRLRDKMIISGGRLPDDDQLLCRVAHIRDVRTFKMMRPALGLQGSR